MPRQSKPEKKNPVAVSADESKGITKKSAKPVKDKKQKEESSDSEFSFEEGTDEDSTELSSSGTDEFGEGKGQVTLELDPKTEQTLKEKLKAKKKDVLDIKHTDPRGVIMLKNVPYGFSEPEMKKFFSQFGTVTRVALRRSKKTGRSKAIAFVEFLDAVVADIVAETMNDYIMFKRMLKVSVVPPEKVTNRLFLHTKVRNYHHSNQSAHMKRHVRKVLEAEEKNRNTLKELGIEYDFPGFVRVLLVVSSNLKASALKMPESVGQ